MADVLQQQRDLHLEGFIDDDQALWDTEVGGLPVLGGLSWLEGAEPRDYRVACAIGRPELRKRIIQHVEGLHFTMIGAISPLAYVSPEARLGKGVTILPFAAIGPSAFIGDHSFLYYSAVVAHDSRIGAYSILCPGSQIAGGVTIGEGCWLGISSTVIQGITIGTWSYIAAGATVTSDLPAGVLAGGVPARVMRQEKV